MRGVGFRRALWVLLWVLAGCRCETGALSFDDYCSARSRAECELGQRCGTITRSVDCAHEPPYIDCFFFRQSVDAGALQFDAEAAGRCIQKFDSAKCPAYPDRTFPCEVFPGKGEVGDSCGKCREGLVCRSRASAFCGICESWERPRSPTAALGEVCIGAEVDGCDDDLICVGIGAEEPRCIPRLSKGETCDLGARFCERGLSCRPEVGLLRCGYLSELGEFCDSVPCTGRLRCVANRCESLLPNGESCTDASDCVSSVCRGGRCEPPAEVGEPCANACRMGLVCIDGLCSEPIPAGQACSELTQCGPGARCDEGGCHDYYIECR